MASDARSRLTVWRILVMLGAIGLGIGLIAGVPILALLGGPVAIVGTIGLMAGMSKVKAEEADGGRRVPGAAWLP